MNINTKFLTKVFPQKSQNAHETNRLNRLAIPVLSVLAGVSLIGCNNNVD